MWVKYIKLEFNTHFGNEHYCPVSLLRVFGKTMMEDLHKSSEEKLSFQKQETKTVTVESTKRSTPLPSTTPKAKAVANPFQMFQDIDSYDSWMYELPSSFKKEFISLSVRIREIIKAHGDFNNQEEIPSSQENIYKSIMKRLSNLERNSSIYDKIIIEQSKFVDEMLERFDKDLNLKLLTMHYAWNTSVINIIKDLVILIRSLIYIFRQMLRGTFLIY